MSILHVKHTPEVFHPSYDNEGDDDGEGGGHR